VKLATVFLTIAYISGGVSAELVITPVPVGAPAGLSTVFSKHVDVLGLHVFAKNNVPDIKVLHCANVLAQWLDNNEDGVVDNLAVHQVLVTSYASMLMWQTETEAEADFPLIPDSTWDNYQLQDLYGFETNLGYPANQQFDATLEETLHLVTHGGYAQTYPSVFGEFSGTQVAIAMNANISGGWYHYADPTCDYGCKVTEYTYWALTSLLGAQDYPWRIKQIANEWELPTNALMHQHDAAMSEIMTDPQWNLATSLPDGSYTPSAPCPEDLDGSGVVAVGDVLLVIDGWGGAGIADLNGDGTVNVTDLLALVNAWGPC